MEDMQRFVSFRPLAEGVSKINCKVGNRKMDLVVPR